VDNEIFKFSSEAHDYYGFPAGDYPQRGHIFMCQHMPTYAIDFGLLIIGAGKT
jgi:hypothetical protein